MVSDAWYERKYVERSSISDDIVKLPCDEKMRSGVGQTRMQMRTLVPAKVHMTHVLIQYF
jgi:hypothetical protein